MPTLTELLTMPAQPLVKEVYKKVNVQIDKETRRIFTKALPEDVFFYGPNHEPFSVMNGNHITIKDYRLSIAGNITIYEYRKTDDNIIECIAYRYRIKEDTKTINKRPTYVVEHHKDSGLYSRKINFNTGEDQYWSYITNKALMSSKKYEGNTDHAFYYFTDDLMESDVYKKSSIDKVVKDSIHNSQQIDTISKYFTYRSKFSGIDNLLQKGFLCAYEMIDCNCNFHDFFFEGNTFKKNFILPKDCVAYLLSIQGRHNRINYHILGCINQMQFKSKNINLAMLKEIYSLIQNRDYRTQSFFFNLKNLVVNHNLKLRDILDYLVRTERYQAIDAISASQLLSDYYNAVKSLNLLNFDRYPTSLKREHDIAAREAANYQDTHKKESFKAIMEFYAHLEFKNDKYCIVVPKTADDLIEEGDTLRHCVGSYVNYVVNKTCVIFFVREIDKPDKPFYTLEVHINGAKGQLLGMFNDPANKDIHNFANDFIKSKAKTAITENHTKTGSLKQLTA